MNKYLILFSVYLIFSSCGKPKERPQDQIEVMGKLERFKNVPSEGFLSDLVDIKDAEAGFTKDPIKREGAQYLKELEGYNIVNWVATVDRVWTKNSASVEDMRINANEELFVLKDKHVKFLLLVDAEKHKSIKLNSLVSFSGAIQTEKSISLRGALTEPEFVISNASLDR